MTNTPTEMHIPKDILETAWSCVDQYTDPDLVPVIAMALAAERERCSRIAINQAPATQDFADAPLQELATRIASKIRSVDK